ncbi:MAG: hypothetical protein V4596_04175 [Bdellovibrionota bacterium]
MVKRFLGAGNSLLWVSLFRQVLAFAIIFQISFGSTLGFTADSGEAPRTKKEYSVFLPEEFKKLAEENFLKDASQFSEDSKLLIENLFNEPAKVQMDLIVLARALAEKAEKSVNLADDVRSRQKEREVAVEIKGLGKAEFNSFGFKDSGRIFTRFVHYGTDTSYVFIDTDLVPLESLTPEERLELGEIAANNEARTRKEVLSEYERYIALQQMHTKVHPEEYNPFPNLEEINPADAKEYVDALVNAAKQGKPEKKYDKYGKIKTGRLVKVIGYSGRANALRFVKEYPRYESYSPLQKAALYWTSIKKGTRLNWEYWDNGNIFQKPLTFLTGDALISLFSTGIQTGIFVSLKQLQGDSVDPFSVLLVAGWAFAFSITSTARNWINVNSSKSSILFKSFLNSVVFNYILLVAVHGFDTVFSLNEVAFKLSMLNIANAMINNFGKTWWYKVPQMRENAGLNLKEINTLKLRTKIDQSMLEQQTWYLGSNIFRTADLLAMDVLFSIMYLDFSASRLAMIATIPVLHYTIMRYAEKKDFKASKELREEWNKAMYLSWNGKFPTYKGHKIPVLYAGAFISFIKEMGMVGRNATSIIYWPGKVVFNTITAGTKKIVNTLNSLSQKVMAETNPSRSERTTLETTKISSPQRGSLCVGLFSN